MTPIQEQILRSALFVPCNTKKELHRWIKMYLGIDMPDVIVCDDDIHHPPSNSSPMDLIWEIYYKARQGVDPSFQEVLAYAARDSFKTLSASIIELLCIVHLKRDVVHLAAIETQAKFCLDYIRKFLSRPILKEFITNVSRRELTFSRYVNEDETISPVQYKKLSELEKIKYEEEKYKVHITVATVEACNGLHAPFMCVSGDTEVSIQGQGLATVEELAADCLGGADRLVESFEIPVNNVSILSMDPESYELSFKPVTRIKREKRKIVKVKLAIGNRKAWANGDIEYKTIECTPDHKFYVKPFKGQSVKGWWIEAQGLKPDWSVFSAFDEAKVISVRNVTEEKYVYDLAVEGTHTFIANDIVVHNCMDELDIAPPDAFMEAKSIPSSTKDRKLPITFYTSTRKYSYGLVQKEIDRSFTEHTGLQIRHWNFIDVTEKCPTDRHLPEEPKIDIWVNEDILSSLSQEDFDKLPETEKKTYEKLEGYSGCLKNCKIFSSCKGRLATKQTSTSPLLKRIDQTQSNIRKVSLEHAKAQYLCFGPDTKILLSDGTLKSIRDVSVGESVITHTGKTGVISHKFEREYSGKIKVLNNIAWKMGETFVTPEHPYFVNGENFKILNDLKSSTIIKDKNVKTGDYLSFPVDYEVDETEFLKISDFLPLAKKDGDKVWLDNGGTSHCKPISDKIYLSEDFAWIVGFFLAEGSFEKTKNKSDDIVYNCINFTFNRKETEFLDKLKQFAEKLELNTSISYPKNSQTVHLDIYNSILASFFKVLCNEYSDKKTIHQKLMNLNVHFIKSLLDGFRDGDGTKRQENQVELTTTSLNLASQLYTISGRLGLSPRIKRSKYINKPVFRVYYRNDSFVKLYKSSRFKTSDRYNLTRFDGVSEKDYSGVVYNIEVTGDNSYIADGVAVHNCWKPSTAGLVYPYFSREVHEKTASEMVEIFTGEPCTKELDKNGFIKFLQNSGAQFFSGIDWGYTHNYVVVTGAIIAHYLFIIDVIAAGELELPDIIDITKKQVGHLKPICFPDSAYPANIQSFRTNGFVMVDFHKDVLEGVKAVRERLTPGMDRKPTMYFLKGDAGVDGLIKEIQTYHWKLDKAGNLTDDPDKVDDDRCDALRYLCQNVQINKSRFIVSTDFKKTNKTPTQATMENFLKNKINELTGEAGLDADPQILGDEGGIKFVI